MLGHPDAVQGDPQLECEAATRGLSAASARADPEIGAKAADWRLLLQVDSDRASGMMWSDVGMLYYWIRAEDLATCRFDRVQAIVQSH
jgi:uncharacterized protein YwqG